MKLPKNKGYILLVFIVFVLGILVVRYLQVNQDYRLKNEDISAEWKAKLEQVQANQTQVENERRAQNDAIEKNKDSEETLGVVKININTASKERLMDIPGVGEKRAEDIIKYREINGGFKKIEQLKNIKGIGDVIFRELRDLVEV